MKRVFEIDVLHCPHCGGRRRLIALITAPLVVRRILRHLDLPPLGQAGRAVPLVTKTLLFLAEGAKGMIGVPDWAGGSGFRAFDKATGEVVWRTDLPAGATGAPMTYLHGGKQYLVVPLGGRGHEGELVALALPD